MFKRGFPSVVAVVFAVFVLWPGQSSAAGGDLSAGAQKLIQSMADEAIDSLIDKNISAEQREKEFRRLFRTNFDVDAIGKWVLGRYWRTATETERREYLAQFEEFVVKTYAKRFRDYSGEVFSITNTSMVDDSALVHSELTGHGEGQIVRVDWRVASADSTYKIIDVIVEGVSMSQTQRSEFSSVIRRNGGKVTGLIDALRKKNAILNGR